MNGLIPSSQPLLSFAEECNRGKVREENQDTVLHARTALGELSVVADGIGGLEGGGTASRIVVETIHGHLQTLPGDYPADSAIREAAAIANANILAAAAAPDAPFKRMGSTVVLALLQQNAAGTVAWIGHIGDSRAYRLRDGHIRRLTKDHSAVQELIDENLLTPAEAGNHPDASVLTRSLGHYAEVEIDIEAVPLLPGDSLLLCSDGLWGFVPKQEIQTVMADAHLPIESTAKALLEMALAAGGHDNIGIELVRVGLPPAPAPEAVPQPVKEPQPVEEQDPIKVEAPIAPSPPLEVEETPKAQRPLKAEEPLKLGFVAILSICLLGAAALGAVLYFAFYKH
jgi:serine/threonine protein phosphatase PrpC